MKEAGRQCSHCPQQSPTRVNSGSKCYETSSFTSGLVSLDTKESSAAIRDDCKRSMYRGREGRGVTVVERVRTRSDGRDRMVGVKEARVRGICIAREFVGHFDNLSSSLLFLYGNSRQFRSFVASLGKG